MYLAPLSCKNVVRVANFMYIHHIIIYICNCCCSRECPACFCFQSRRKTSYRQSCDTLGHISLVTKVSFLGFLRELCQWQAITIRLRGTMPANENKYVLGHLPDPTCFLCFCCSLQIVEAAHMGTLGWETGRGAPLCLPGGLGLTTGIGPHRLLGSQAQ